MEDFNNQNPINQENISVQQLNPTPTPVNNPVVSQPMVSQTPVTPEIKPSSTYARWASNLLDGIYLGLISIPIFIVFELLINGGLSIDNKVINELENNAYLQIIVLIGLFTYSVGFNVNKGATPGKSSYGLQIVKYGTMEKMGYGRAFVRELLKLVSYIPVLGTIYFIINVIIILFSKQKRTIYDLIVGTQVIKIK